MNDIYSFYQLISKYQIEIPIIQRDYAQGRNNPKADDVRKSMVTDLISAVKGEKRIFFDFVYGRIDDNKFIPFDGQQRLTTMFLFHKYIFERCQSSSTCKYKSNCICKDILLRFSYATRQSSREFCELLVSNRVIPLDDYYKKVKDEYIRKLVDKQEPEAEIEKKVSEYDACKTDWMSSYIKNLSWYYSDWEKDPTIAGMLTMLDEINNQLRSINIDDYKVLAERLTSGCSCPITFHFVDMGEHKLSDEAYVKMNARGKTLTPFENFKASLEQYLEKKKEGDILSRLKENADGKWLDLFWDVVNEGKEEKELPDDTMMSFINRHLMNVWRCWYGQNTKTENERKNLSGEDDKKQKEYDAFNKRIIAEMPLYPTKDDFVSWEIYQYVLDNCGIDKCLSPIVNIWDELCMENNCVEQDCQAVWNRGKGKTRWKLYEGDKNKDNRETYPSRVAFYALLKYFEHEKKETDTRLAQWMRVAWNIIENSTIDSSDSYQSALSLIKKLSGKCYDIYDALANQFDSFELGNQYHAQAQVQEERAKAIKINQDSSWKTRIIEAETFAFFKGAIRFLFTKETVGDDWVHFDTKWDNAKKFFDENGVKDGDNKYRSEAILLKTVLYHVNDFWNLIEPQIAVFDNKAETWKNNILLEEGWKNAVHQIMMGNLDMPPREGDCLIYRNLYSTELLNYVSNHLEGSRIKWIHDHRAIYPPYYEGIMLDDDNRYNKFYRNKVLSSDSRFKSSQKIGDLYFKGWDVNFEYNGHSFQWNTDEKVYLLEGGKRKPKNENDCYHTDVTNLSDSVELIKKLDCLIAQAFPHEADKTCCNNCQDKTCE